MSARIHGHKQISVWNHQVVVDEDIFIAFVILIEPFNFFMEIEGNDMYVFAFGQLIWIIRFISSGKVLYYFFNPHCRLFCTSNTSYYFEFGEKQIP